MVVRYADNEDDAGQQVAESEVLVFEKINTFRFKEKYKDGGDFCLPPGRIGEAKGCVGYEILKL
uniref:Uncharacterized protein n=1 Tax=Romanomermis culicivorax TaxID=13658 RepID=A0A915HJB3_ROMCU